MADSRHIVLLLYFLCFSSDVSGSLIVNVKSPDGEILKETFITNTHEDSITLEYELENGVYLTHVIDFQQNLQLFRVITLGEEELLESPYKESCFVIHFDADDFITPDAMSKLRQKNPETIRVPESDRGSQEIILDLTLNVVGSSIMSHHIPELCTDASASSYASQSDLKDWVKTRGNLDLNWSSVQNIAKKSLVKETKYCRDALDNYNGPCLCSLEACVFWYPCALKYCTEKDVSGKMVSFRCGIRTCRKCFTFKFVISNKSDCYTE